MSDGCSSTDSCSARSDMCPQRATCADTWNSHKCVCDVGFVGADCANICEYNPCENNATCQIDQSIRRGYKCGCQGDTSGDYCEVALDQPCPATWWGYPVCGPCRCDTDKGYDPNCNKTNGQCVCQVNIKEIASPLCCLLSLFLVLILVCTIITLLVPHVISFAYEKFTNKKKQTKREREKRVLHL